MEDKIIMLLDHLTVEQTEMLLNEDIDMKISHKEMHRIKNSVHRKIGFKRLKAVYVPQKLAACAAALFILFISLSFIGLNNVAAAIDKFFSFIPGYGIVENNESIQYILSQPVSVENNNVKFSLMNAIATKSGITVTFSLERKNYDDQQLIKDKQAERESFQNGSSSHPNVVLYAGEYKITEYTGYTGGSGKSDMSTFSYDLKPDEISTSETYRLEYADYALLLKFKLKNYSSYHTLEEIGATGYNNDISITAVPTFSDGQVQVDLYAINKNGYILDSFSKTGKKYLGDDLHLETDSGIKSYTIPDGYGGVNGRFLFDIKPEDKNFTLTIPYISVKSDEEKDIALKIPTEGEKVSVNLKIKFKDCNMTIVDVEKTLSHHIGEYGELKMTIKYENKSENKIMLHPEFIRTDFFGNAQSGAWSADMDENGIYTTVYYALNKGESGKLRLKVYEPVYLLTDEYKLTFSK